PTAGPHAATTMWAHTPPLSLVLQPIHHGVFWFLGYDPMPPFVVHAPRLMTDQQRQQALRDVEVRAERIEADTPLQFQRLADFPSFGEHDRLGRYMGHGAA